MRISDLTKGERIFLARKRDGLSMAEAAKNHEISLLHYRQWEHDSAEVDDAPTVPLGTLSLTEEFMILRRRSGKTVAELAGELECCPWWFRQMELGEVNSDRLKKFWGMAA